MSHHGREDEREACTVDWHEVNLNRYAGAVILIINAACCVRLGWRGRKPTVFRRRRA